MDADDSQLLALTHRGNDAAARELWRRYAARLTAYARAIVGEQSASDIVQCVFVGVLSLSRAHVLAIRDVPAYFVGAIRRATISHERERLRRSTRERGELAQARLRARAAQIDDPHITLDLRAAVDRLPRRLREVLVLKHHAGLTFDQMAIALDCNRSTLASRYQDALRQLRAVWSVGELGGPHDTHEPTPSTCAATSENGKPAIAAAQDPSATTSSLSRIGGVR